MVLTTINILNNFFYGIYYGAQNGLTVYDGVIYYGFPIRVFGNPEFLIIVSQAWEKQP